MKNFYHTYYLLLIAFVGGMMLASCSNESDDWTAENDGQTHDEPADVRQLVAHEVAVSLDDAATRVSYQPADGGDGGLQLAWEASETLGVYIRKADGSFVYAGTVTGAGAAGERGERRFSGTVSEKQEGEQYVYIHPALAGETQGQAAKGVIDFGGQKGGLGCAAHLRNYIPLVWHEGNTLASVRGYAIHLTLTFDEDPGGISQVCLQTMAGAGVTGVFMGKFDASNFTGGAGAGGGVGAGDGGAGGDAGGAGGGAGAGAVMGAASLTITGGNTATKGVDGKWHAEVYIAGSHVEANVFRTKFDVKVVAGNGTYYNEFRSFPGQQDATAITGLPMLANGHCYNLKTAVSKDVAPTVINSQYNVNSLLGMWNQYGKVTDPFSLCHPVSSSADVLSGFPAQLKSNILDKKDAFTARTLVDKSAQGTPTFTWTMVTKQIAGASDGYKQADVTYNNINIVNEATEVYVTFISEYAWSQNLLGYYHYPTGSVPASSNDVLKTIIFPNVSKGEHVPYNKGGVDGGANVNPNSATANVGVAGDAPLAEYTTVQLLYNNPDGTYSKEFPAGTTIGFFMMRDPKASGSQAEEDSSTDGTAGSVDHTGYQPRTDNTLLDWNSWRLFTNTKWNGASGNVGWWNMNCQNFFCSADVGDADHGGVIPGLALYGVKDDASHNYNYSFSAMLFMVSAGVPGAMQTGNRCYFNLGGGALVKDKP